MACVWWCGVSGCWRRSLLEPRRKSDGTGGVHRLKTVCVLTRVSLSTYLRAVRVSERLRENVSIPLAVGGIVSQSSDNCLVVSLYLFVSLLMTCVRRQMFDTKVSTDTCEELSYKLRMLSASTWLGLQNGTIRWSRKMFPTCVATVLAAGTACVSLNNLSVITIAYLFLCVVLIMGSRISITKTSSGPQDENNWSVRLWF